MKIVKNLKDIKELSKKEIPGFYKGYEIKWLKNNPQHPDFNLVAEYEKKISK